MGAGSVGAAVDLGVAVAGGGSTVGDVDSVAGGEVGVGEAAGSVGNTSSSLAAVGMAAGVCVGWPAQPPTNRSSSASAVKRQTDGFQTFHVPMAQVTPGLQVMSAVASNHLVSN